MYKKQTQDVVYDTYAISSFNTNNKKTKKLSHTWTQSLFTLQRPEIPREAESALSVIQGQLTKLGNPLKVALTEVMQVEPSIQMKSEVLVLPRSVAKEETSRNAMDKLREIDLKVMKKAEESKRIMETTSLLSLKTKQKIEELEGKVARLRMEISNPGNRKQIIMKDQKGRYLSSEKLILPRLHKH